MATTASAIWLDTYLRGFDHLFLSIQHFFGEHAGVVLTPLMRFVTFMGEKGWPFFLLALLFLLMADKRDLGVCVFGAVCCGALITNIILKDTIARPRPFESSIEYELWWNAIGSPAEDGFSFPSGHVTACAAGMTAVTLMRGKKWILPSALLVLLMAISRNYLMAHYPSDVVAAALIGVFSGVVAWFITQLIFRFLRKNADKPVFALILDFDIREVLPFQLPTLSLPKGRRAEAPARRSGRAAKTPEAGAEEDVKTYPARRSAAAGAAEAPVRRSAARVSSPRDTAGARSAGGSHDAAATRSAGRHAAPESGSAAKKSARTRTGGYQGKH